jgi:hypothetical protein
MDGIELTEPRREARAFSRDASREAFAALLPTPFFEVKRTRGAIGSSFDGRSALVDVVDGMELAVLRGAKRSLYRALKSVSDRWERPR